MSIQSTYQKWTNHAKQHISPTSLDVIETALSLIAPAALGYFGLSNQILRIAGSLGCGIAGSYLFHKFLKSPAIEREVETIVSGSRDSTKPSALFIHTKNDHNGVFNCTHSIPNTYQKFALHFSIDRIRGFSYEERIKSQGKTYDTIAILAHGHPLSISMDGEGVFFSFHEYSAKKLNFLASRLKEGGRIILDSCSTAQGENNIAQRISETIPHATVYGSSKQVYAVVGIEYAPDLTPAFNDGCLRKGRDTTRIYKAGKQINCK